MIITIMITLRFGEGRRTVGQEKESLSQTVSHTREGGYHSRESISAKGFGPSRQHGVYSERFLWDREDLLQG